MVEEVTLAEDKVARIPGFGRAASEEQTAREQAAGQNSTAATQRP
jgi:hypothetical protein